MKNFFICDCHNDFLTELDEENIADYVCHCKRENVKVLSSSFWSSKMNKPYILSQLGRRADLLKNCCPDYLFHIEDLWWIESERDLKKLLKIHPFSCSLTWNDDNSLAGGALGSLGLTKWGQKCTDKHLERGIIIDTAHLNRKSFYQVANIIKSNIYCSHTGFYGMKHHKRNLTDKQIDFIVNSNGFIGMYFYHKALKVKESFSISDIVKNLKYFTARWGYDNIGIGSDFYGIEVYPEGLCDYSDFDKLYSALKYEGLSQTQIEKIFYKNFIDFLERVDKNMLSGRRKRNED